MAGLDLTHRPRRLRQTEWTRRLVRENVLTTNDLIWPIFIMDGEQRREPVSSMPGVERLTIDEAAREAARAQALGIPAIALFPNTDVSLRDETGKEAFNENNLVCRACREIAKAAPGVGIMTDVALDPYTSHGHDGLLRGDEIVNDETVEALVKQALNQARAGCRHRRAVRHDGRAHRRHPAGRSTRKASSACRSCPMRRSTRPPSTAPSATRWARAASCAATSARTRWTPPIPTRRCARSRSISNRAPTW